MRKIADIRTFDDRAFQRRMMRLSAAVAVVGAVAGALWFTVGAPRLGLSGSEFAAVVLEGSGPRLGFLGPGALWFAAGAVAVLASLGVHELVHALFFKLFAPAGARVTFGANWDAGMLYACAEGIVYTRRQYLAIALAPTLAVTVLVLAAGAACGWPLLGYIVAVAHLTGCTGDWCYAATIVRDARITHCEDCTWGVRFYGAGEEVPGPDTTAEGDGSR
ncbi:DUF3267 domain-containing protein [Enorma burkinafasonensis]|uniref:DUF3267 domain-containing protein n=1 Tax=Enorma burkinafasonensis TaxID=2590867 RepID=UPI0011A48ACD|nr:DUF3267 domain-containing protein [Enorma burkinafasonensis]